MKLAEIFRDNMVLQRGKPIAVFGKGNGTGYIEFCGKTTHFSDKNGEFCVYLPTEEAGGPYDMTVCLNNETQIIKNVLIGDVFMAAGQSNMEFPTSETIDIEIFENNNLCLFTEPNIPNDAAVINHITPEWNLANKESILKFSALGYKVGDILEKPLHIPIGIISCNKGASRVDTWTDPKIADTDEYKRFIPKKSESVKMYKFNEGSFLFENKLANIIPYTMKGVLWYQGESNARSGDAENYKTLLTIMINNWRELFGANLPFYCVQIMPYVYGENWEIVRKATEEVAKTVDNVYMTTLVNTGENDKIHPQKKNTIAVMLANAVLTTIYGRDYAYSGPVFNKCILKPDHAEISFIFREGLHFDGEPKDIFVTYENGETELADCKIKGNKLFVYFKGEKVAKISMGYCQVPNHNLYNSSGYLASPFEINL